MIICTRARESSRIPITAPPFCWSFQAPAVAREADATSDHSATEEVDSVQTSAACLVYGGGDICRPRDSDDAAVSVSTTAVSA